MCRRTSVVTRSPLRIGLWILSGQGCAGFCGPRYRWEEEDAEKAAAAINDNVSDFDTLPWSWKECTILRVKDAYDFCTTPKQVRAEDKGGKEQTQQAPVPIEGLERIFAAVGLHSAVSPARRGVLSDELFESPRHTPELDIETGTKAKPAAELSNLVPPIPAVQQREKQGADPSGPLMKLPYPFTGYGAQVSSEDVVPFPPSPAIEEKEVPIEGEEAPHTGEEEDEEEAEVEGEEEEEEEGEEEESEVPSSERRTSGSMSSLGRPVVSRYPFQFRRPRGSISSASHMSPQTHSTPYSTHTRSTQSRSTRHSRSTQSTGNVESTDSHSPRSNASSNVSPMHSSFSGSIIPMPPRHPQAQQGQRRARAGTVPAAVPPSPGSPSPVVFPGGRPRARTRTESMATDPSTSFGPIPIGSFESDGEDDHSLMEVPEAEGSIEEAERQDSVGLLSAAPSPRASLANLRHRASGLSHRRSNGSRSHSGGSRSASNSRSRTNSGTSISEVARSRAQSLIQSIGAASRSSIDLVRSRTNSLQRLADSPYASTSSEAVLSSPENHTFGHPLREQWRAEEGMHEMSDIAESETQVPVTARPHDSDSDSDREQGHEHGVTSNSSSQELHTAPSVISRTAPSEHQSEFSIQTEREGVPIAGRERGRSSLTIPVPAQESNMDLSTAPQSFITAPTSREDTTSSSGQTRRTWDTMEHYTHGVDWHPV